MKSALFSVLEAFTDPPKWVLHATKLRTPAMLEAFEALAHAIDERAAGRDRQHLHRDAMDQLRMEYEDAAGFRAKDMEEVGHVEG